MAEQAFGIKEFQLIGSGTPTISSPNNLNLKAATVAISTNISIGGTMSVIGGGAFGIGSTVGIGSTLYVVYFTAKIFKIVEYQRNVEFSEFKKEFFIMVLYPVGIWLLQPKINKIVKK